MYLNITSTAMPAMSTATYVHKRSLKNIIRGFQTRMVYLYYISCLRYTILVRNLRYCTISKHCSHVVIKKLNCTGWRIALLKTQWFRRFAEGNEETMGKWVIGTTWICHKKNKRTRTAKAQTFHSLNTYRTSLQSCPLHNWPLQNILDSLYHFVTKCLRKFDLFL